MGTGHLTLREITFTDLRQEELQMRFLESGFEVEKSSFFRYKRGKEQKGQRFFLT